VIRCQREICTARISCCVTLEKKVKSRWRFYPAYHIFAKRDTETIQLKKDLEVLYKILLHKEENDIIIKGDNHNVSKS
jgi:hypothetical protein